MELEAHPTDAGPLVTHQNVNPGWTAEQSGARPPREAAPDGDELEEMFRTYYRSIANPARMNLRAMRQAVSRLDPCPSYVLTDGFPVDGLGVPGLAVWKGDRVAACIAAASVIAKVTRDRIMAELHHDYPVYDFATHKGYVTATHTAALEQHGPCPEHRFSYVNVRGVDATNARAFVAFMTGQWLVLPLIGVTWTNITGTGLTTLNIRRIIHDDYSTKQRLFGNAGGEHGAGGAGQGVDVAGGAGDGGLTRDLEPLGKEHLQRPGMDRHRPRPHAGVTLGNAAQRHRLPGDLVGRVTRDVERSVLRARNGIRV